jgi:hypothetical protein
VSEQGVPADSSADPATPALPERPPRARGRQLVVHGLIVITTVLAVVAMFAVWANRQLLDPDNWSATSTQLLQNATVREATANYAVDQLYANVDVAGVIRSGLPRQLQSLAAPAAGALRNAAVQGARLALSDARVQNLWAIANRAAAHTFVVIVEGGRGPVRINRGAVTLDLAPIVDDIAGRLGLPAQLGSKLPASIARLRVLRSNQLALVQNIGRAVKGLALWLAIIVPLLYAAAIGLARGHRRRTLMSVGWAMVTAGVLVLLGRSILISQVPASVVSDASLRPAAAAVTAIATSLLPEIAAEFVVVGLIVVAAAWLAGPGRPARAMRRACAPFLRDRPGAAYAILAVLVALILIWRPLRALGTPLGVIVFVALAFLAALLLRRETLAEFPTAAAGDTAAAIRARVRRLREHRGHHATDHANGGGLVSEELERLVALRDSGAITADEYQGVKARLLGTGPSSRP